MTETSVIITGVDGSARDSDALAFAGRLARTLRASILVVHAHAYGRLSGLLGPGEYETVVRKVAESVFGHVAEHLAGLEVSMELVADASPAAALHRLARARDARVLVVGSSERGRVGLTSPGSVSERAVYGSPCPVAVAPRGYEDEDYEGAITVGVGFDGSREADGALAEAVELASAAHARLRLIAVFRAMAFGSVGIGGTLPSTSANRALRQELQAHLERAADHIEGIAVDPILLEGDAAERLAEQSEALQMLVVGSRGYGPVRSVLLGGVSGHLIREARCPVIVCPRSGAE